MSVRTWSIAPEEREEVSLRDQVSKRGRKAPLGYEYASPTAILGGARGL